MKNFTLSVLILLSFLSFRLESNAAPCNWKSRITNFTTWDSCANGKASLNGYVTLNTKGCFTYQWKVGSTVVGTNSPVVTYRITQNGTYTLCVKITDTCNNCDTTLCRTFNISCFSSCNWKGRTPSFTAWDTCKGNGGRNSVNASISFNNSVTCFKYSWTVNGKAAGTNNKVLNYPVTANGTYVVCVKVTDTCKKCDTTFCSTRTISCFSSSSCIWKSKISNFYAWDTCVGASGRNSINAYIALNTKGCFKYLWKVNSTILSTTGIVMNYKITANGTYTICVKISDTCNNCDTVLCTTRTISCFGNTCNWKNQITNFYAWDTCKGTSGRNSLNAYIAFNNKGCFKYQWSVNKALAGNGNVLHYPISANGTYTVCVKVTDTCNNCDTTICSTRTITCFNSSTCKWYQRTPTFNAWDTCKGNGAANSINAYINFKSFYCLKYVWTVNGVTKSSRNAVLHYPVNANGTYVICVKVIDSCNNCDTTFCSTRTISCFSTSKCNWKSKISNFYAWDTCKGNGGRNSLNAYIAFKTGGCFKYMWKVNGTVVNTSGNILNYKITSNGTYTICVKVTDTCNNCDTMLCVTKTISCFNKCIFNSRNLVFKTNDTCKNGKGYISGYISLGNKTCLKYSWKVAGVTLGSGQNYTYAVPKNGTYVICVKVMDTCNNCDTTICVTKTINCNTVGLKKLTGAVDQIEFYPNPVQNTLNIDWSGSKIQFEVMNMLGSRIFNGELTTGKNAIQTDTWSNGVYLVRVNTNTGLKTYRIVVNR